ncbi:MAG: archaemetzincin family Zn-dependent metalloprotease [Bacteroidota bacterium]
MPAIILLPIKPVHRGLVDPLVSLLALELGSTVTVEEQHGLNPAFAFDLKRNQHNSTALLASILQKYPENGNKILGITGLDLFVPVLTYVFGEAQLSGRAAVVSTFRLDETLYGFPANRTLLEERLLKESVHELGHTYGLIHCRNYNCAMHASTAVEEIDIKGKSLCEECRKAVKN